MITFDDVTKEKINELNPNWSQIPDLSYRLLTQDLEKQIHYLI